MLFFLEDCYNCHVEINLHNYIIVTHLRNIGDVFTCTFTVQIGTIVYFKLYVGSVYLVYACALLVVCASALMVMSACLPVCKLCVPGGIACCVCLCVDRCVYLYA